MTVAMGLGNRNLRNDFKLQSKQRTRSTDWPFGYNRDRYNKVSQKSWIESRKYDVHLKFSFLQIWFTNEKENFAINFQFPTRKSCRVRRSFILCLSYARGSIRWAKFNRFSYLSARKTAHMRKAVAVAATATYCETNGKEKLSCRFLKARNFQWTKETSWKSPMAYCVAGCCHNGWFDFSHGVFRAECNKKTESFVRKCELN